MCWSCKDNKERIASYLKHYVLDCNESKDFHSDCYAEMDELAECIEKLIKSLVNDILKEHGLIKAQE